VSDTVVGMDDEVRSHVFEPFFSTKAGGQGIGLGLATVFGIVTQNGGHIHVYSVVGQGTTFRIYLPRARGSGAAARSRAPRLVADALARGSETVLVVEDEAAVRHQAVQALEGYGYQVLTAGDGATALEVSRGYAGAIDLLLTDMVMPHMSGVELAEELQSERPEMRVIYMSGYMPDTIVQHGVLEAGMVFLPKPFSVESLAHQVRVVLDGKA